MSSLQLVVFDEQHMLKDASEADRWIYVGEGNLNLVLRYIGDNDNFKGKVLRVLKSPRGESGKDDRDSVRFTQLFFEKVIRPLLGEEYAVPMHPVFTSAVFLKEIASRAEPYRPDFRLKKEINVNASISYLLEDLSPIHPELPTITVELKPKWGFKPTSSYLSKNNLIKSTYCRFCMHSHLKAKSSTGYCPLDLYSECRERIRMALQALLKDRLNQKTLKINVNGSSTQLYPDNQPAAGYSNTEICDILQEILYQDPILQILKGLQMNLDKLDVEAIYPMHLQHKSLPVDDIDIWQKVVQNFQDKCANKTLFTNSREEQIQKIYEYLLSMTFKDCSLMINIVPESSNQKLKHGKRAIVLENGTPYYYSIKVIDTDLKSIHKIPYWFDLDQSIINHALKTNFQKEKHCK